MKKIGPYTLLDNKENKTYYFYPTLSLEEKEIVKKINMLCIKFDIYPYNDEIYSMNVSVLNKDNETKYSTFTINIIESRKNVVNIIKILNNNEVEVEDEINFNTLNYQDFLKLLTNNKDLQKIIPSLKAELENYKNSLNNEKETAKIIDIPTCINYFQNVTGYLIDSLEHLVTTDDELDVSKEILKSVKRTHEVVLYNEEYCHLAYLSLYSNIVLNIKSSNQKNTRSLDIKDLKCDTNKTELSYNDFDKIINSFINNSEIDEELNIIQERIEYELNTKQRVVSFTNHSKIILADDKYIDDKKRVRAVKESDLKQLVAFNLKENNYRILPRNEVIIYNYKENNKDLDFVAIISLDMVEKIIKLITIDMNKETKSKTDILRSIDNLKKSSKINSKPNNIRALIYTLIMMETYYYKNINNKILLFSSGQNIINLEFKNGGYDISIINRNNERLIGKLSKITDDTKDNIKKALNINEKEFNKLINKIIMDNIVAATSLFNIDIDIKEISHNDIYIMFNRTLKKDIFRAKFKLDELLITLTNVKIGKVKKIEQHKEFVTEEQDEYILGIYKEDYDYIIRKSNTIKDIMSTSESKNKTYLKIADLYSQFVHSKNTSVKKKIIFQLAELLEIEDIRTKD